MAKPIKIKVDGRIMYVTIDGHFDMHNVSARAEWSNYDGGIFFTEVSTGKHYTALSSDYVVLPSNTTQIALVLLYILRLICRAPFCLLYLLKPLFLLLVFCIPICIRYFYCFAFGDSTDAEKYCINKIKDGFKETWEMLIHGKLTHATQDV